MFRRLFSTGWVVLFGLVFVTMAVAQDVAPSVDQPTVDQSVETVVQPPVTPSPRVVPKAKKGPAKPYKGLFYNNDFSYLEDPCNDECYFGDFLKRNRLGSHLIWDVGGEYRLRQQNEHLLGRNSDFLLQRTRVYANVQSGWFRAYAEGIDAVSSFEDVLPRGIEENRFDALNLFGDLKVFDGCSGSLWVRGGRQELLYGAQRLVSPLDWSNTRRTFDGVKAYWKGTDWDLDAWWTRPIPFGQHLAGGNTDHNFDNPNHSQDFIGVYASYKALKNQKLDFYWLRLAEYDLAAPSFDINTLGMRWEGSRGDLLWAFEGGHQFGDFAGLKHSAGFYTLGAGRKLNLPCSPTLWVYYDWATGDKDPADLTHGTFNQMFPLGHKYLGFMDLVGRQNIEDWNLLLTASPHAKVKLLLWFHIFKLQQANDALYNAGGAPFVAAGNSQDVGQELDFTTSIALNPRADLLFGYSHLFSGDFLRAQTGFGDSDFYYGQFKLRF